MAEQINILVESLRVFWAQFVGYLPRVLGALILLILGWILAKVMRKGTIRALKFLRVDQLSERSGIEDFLLQGGVRYTMVTLLANLVYWFIMFGILLAVLNGLGLNIAAELFHRIIFYIPNVVVAIIVLIFGSLFSKIVEGISFSYLNNIGISGAKVMSSIAQYAILIFVFSIALEQLSIGGQILVSAFQIAFGALCLALALAFGIGGKEWASQILEKMSRK